MAPHWPEDSFGRIPALVLRLCCVAYLLTVMANVISLFSFSILVLLGWPHRASAFTALVLIFIFVTSRGGEHSNWKRSWFSDKLMMAVLIAALIRMRDGWPALAKPVEASASLEELLPSLWRLSGFVAPLLLVGANLGRQLKSRKQVLLTGITGICLPMIAMLLFLGVLSMAANAIPSGGSFPVSALHRALFMHVSIRSGDVMLAVAYLTNFGLLRFCARSCLAACTGFRWNAVLVPCFIVAILVAPSFEGTAWLATSARCLAVAAAVVSARPASEASSPSIKWIGLLAFGAGLASPIYVPWFVFTSVAPGEYGWLLVSYMIAFLVCRGGTLIQVRYDCRHVDSSPPDPGADASRRTGDS